MKRITAVFVVICLLAGGFVVFHGEAEKSMSWWNTAYGKRIAINITNPAGTAYDNVVHIVLNNTYITYASMLPSGDDLVIVDENGAIMNYTIISWSINETLLGVHLSVPANSNRTIWAYYNSTNPVPVALRNTSKLAFEPWSNSSDLGFWALNTSNGSYAVQQYSTTLAFLNQTLNTATAPIIYSTLAMLNVSQMSSIAWELNASLPDNASFVSLNLNYSDGRVLRYICMSSGNYTDADPLNSTGNVAYLNLTGTPVSHDGIEFMRYERNITSDSANASMNANLSAISIEVCTIHNASDTYHVWWNSIAACAEPAQLQVDYGAEENLTGPMLTLYIPEPDITVGGNTLMFAGACAPTYANVSEVRIIGDGETVATLMPEGLWYARVDISSYAPGMHTFEVKAIDEMGVATHVFLHITKSTLVAPQISITYPANNTKVNDTENCTGILSNANAVRMRVNNGGWQNAQANQSNWWCVYNFSLLPFGRYLLIAEANNTTTGICNYTLAIVTHGTAPQILSFNVYPQSQISDNDTFDTWANISAVIGFSAYAEYSLSPNFTSPVQVLMTHVSGNTYTAHIPQRFDTGTTIYFRVKVVDADAYVRYSSALQRTVDKSYATGSIPFPTVPDISQGATILVNSYTIVNTFGTPVVNGTLFEVWADYGNINYISGHTQVAAVQGKISFYYTGTTPCNDTIHAVALLGNATGTCNVNVHALPGILSYTPSTNLGVPGSTVNITFTNSMNQSTFTPANVSTTSGSITGMTWINQSAISIDLAGLAYNTTFYLVLSVKDIYGGALNQALPLSTATISTSIVLIPDAYTVDTNDTVYVNSSIIYDSSGRVVQDGIPFFVNTTFGYVNSSGYRNVTVYTSAGRIGFTIIGEGTIGTANIGVNVSSAYGNASGALSVHFADMSAPLQPVNLTAAPSTWSASNSFTVRWENPYSVTPIIRAYYKFGSEPDNNNDYSGYQEELPEISEMTISVPNEGRWNVYIWLSDAANNTDYSKYALVTLYLDASSPVINGISIPWITTVNLINVEINAGDTLSGIAGYYTRIYKNGTTPPDFAFSTSNAFQLTLSNEGAYTFECIAVDNVGHNSSIGSAYVLYDLSSPAGGISISNKPYTNNRALRIDVGASDSVSGVEKMMFSINDPSFSNSSWINFAISYTLYLTGNDGQYTIYAKFKDFAGHESAVVYDNITLDTTPPVNCSVTIENGAKYTNSTTVHLTINATDALSGVSGFTIAWISGENGTWYNYTQNLTVNLQNETEGLHVIYVTVYDIAGNSAHLNASIYFDKTRPTGTIQCLGYTNTTAITLNLSASDNIGSVRYVRLAETLSAIDAATWVDFSTIIQFNISEGDGEKTIYAQFMTDLGEISDVVHTSTILDTTVPTLTIQGLDSSNTVTLTDNNTYNITWNAFDNNGITDTVIYVNSSEGTDWVEVAHINTRYFVLTLSDNYTYTLKVRVYDPAGNIREKSFVVVVNINYEPVFVNESIPTDLRTGMRFQFYVNFSDVKNDTLTYTWYVDDDVAGSGNMLEFMFRTPGAHTLKVVVTDGKYTLTKTWNVTVAETVVPKSILDYLPWALPVLLILVFIVVVILLLKRKKSEIRASPATEGGESEAEEVQEQQPEITDKAMEESEMLGEEYGITPELEKEIKAYVKQNPGIYLTKLASDIAGAYGMREIDVMTAVQMMEVDGNLSIQVDEEGRTRVYPP